MIFFFLSFSSQVAKTQLDHCTKRVGLVLVVRTQINPSHVGPEIFGFWLRNSCRGFGFGLLYRHTASIPITAEMHANGVQ